MRKYYSDVKLNEKMDRFNHYLYLFIPKAGFTSYGSFAEAVGISRQTCYMARHGKVKPSKLRYLAMRALLENELSPEDNAQLKNMLGEKQTDDWMEEVMYVGVDPYPYPK